MASDDHNDTEKPALPPYLVSVIATDQVMNNNNNKFDKLSETSCSETSTSSEDAKDVKDAAGLTNQVPKPKQLFGCRHIFALMGFLGLASVYMMRINMSVAIVDMVKQTPHKSSSPSLAVSFHYFGRTSDDNATDSCPDNGGGGGDGGSEGEFDWDSETQGLILGAFFWGYMITQIPGGMLAERFGGKYVLGIGILLTGFFSMMTPLAARHGGSGAVIAVRVLTGLSEGVSFPSANAMISKWVPTLERTTIGAFVLAGTQFGTVIILPLAGLLCDLEALGGGWPLAFYLPGVVGAVWFVAWVFLVYDTPETHPRISEDEKRYILASIGETKKISFKDTPWKKMLTSVHLWAILAAHLGHSWGLSMLLTELPTYMSTVLHFDMKANGLLSAIPYLAMWITSIIFSVTADNLRKRKILSTTIVRKLFTTVGLLFPACFLIGAGYTGCDRVATLLMLTFATGFNGAVYSGFLVNHVDIASNYAGTMMGITNCVASICGFLAPTAVSAIVTTSGSTSQWRTVFFLSAGIYAGTNLFYVIFGTGVEQSWNKIVRSRRSSSSSAHDSPRLSVSVMN